MNLDVTAREEATRALAQSEKRLRSTLDGMLSGETDINAFLSHLAVGKDVAASTQNQALSALLVAARSRAPATGHRGTAVPLSRHRSLTGRCRGLAALAAELRFVSRTMGLSDCLEPPPSRVGLALAIYAPNRVAFRALTRCRHPGSD